MKADRVKDVIDRIIDGALTYDEAALELSAQAYSDIGYAKIDNDRGARQGIHEIIFSEGKTIEQILGIIAKMLENGRETVILTRLTADFAAKINKKHKLSYWNTARIGLVGVKRETRETGFITVASAGTSDIPVAEEAAVTAELLGCRVERLYDVGVAGLHRLLDNMETLRGARAIVAVAGMEGALPSVIGGLVASPVIAVPTSIGYGASFGGVCALLGMLNSCSSGVSVVNIDNGFGAGYIANMIARG